MESWLRLRMKTALVTLGSCGAILLVYITIFTTSDPAGNGLLYLPDNLSRTVGISVTDQTTAPEKTLNESSNRCRSRENIMFLKTHKCASSTVQNILMRYGDLRNLTIVLPLDGNYLGHPQKFTTNLTLPLPSAFSQHFSIFCHHTRWHRENTKAIMPSDTVYVSILKEPAAMFESLYSWVKLDLRYEVTLQKFVEDPEKYYKNSTIKDFARNPMMFDFGLEIEDFDNPAKIQEKIAEIDQNFSLIMLAEFVDESLVLLRELMCWDWNDVVVFRVNSRKSEYKQTLSPSVQDQIRRWNSADHQFYEHFRARFHNQTRQYGLARMRDDVKTLRELTSQWYNFCVEKEISKNDTQDIRFQVWHPSVSGFQLTDAGLHHGICIRLAMAENPFTDFLRHKFWPSSVMASRFFTRPTTQIPPEFW